MDTVSAESRLDDLSRETRDAALDELAASAAGYPPEKEQVNLHAHTLFSYNPLGYSPSHYAWLAKQEGLAAAGIVDFDVLDGVDEFLAAGARLGLRTCASIETRVFVPEFADKVINSPGEPGIAYHMGAGFTSSRAPAEAAAFLEGLRQKAAARTRDLVERVNGYLDPVRLDFDRDLAPLTPRGNATERHVCQAYAVKAAEQFADPSELRAFWADRLGELPDDLDLPAGPELQALVRAKTMKSGGVGYAQPGRDTFPLMADMDRFSLRCGAIPTLTWLDGTSDGEHEIGRLFEVAKASGAAALNIIPDRNFTRGVKDEKLHNLYAVTERAEREGFPVMVGTEMNSPGQRFVDDFESDELKPLVPVFMKGAYIVYAHTVLQRHGGMGYLSPWAEDRFEGVASKNAFFAELGEELRPEREEKLAGLDEGSRPEEILDRATG